MMDPCCGDGVALLLLGPPSPRSPTGRTDGLRGFQQRRQWFASPVRLRLSPSPSVARTCASRRVGEARHPRPQRPLNHPATSCTSTSSPQREAGSRLPCRVLFPRHPASPEGLRDRSPAQVSPRRMSREKKRRRLCSLELLLREADTASDASSVEEGSLAWVLPNEMWVHVFEELSPRDLSACRLACALWNELASEGRLWRRLYRMTWGAEEERIEAALASSRKDHWREAYRRRWESSLAETASVLMAAAEEPPTRWNEPLPLQHHHQQERARRRYTRKGARNNTPNALRGLTVRMAAAPGRPNRGGDDEQKPHAATEGPRSLRQRAAAEERRRREIGWQEALLCAHFAAIDRERLHIETHEDMTPSDDGACAWRSRWMEL